MHVQVRHLVLLTQACEAGLYAAQAGEGRWQVISRAGLSPAIPLSKLLRQLEEGKLRSKDLVQAEQSRVRGGTTLHPVAARARRRTWVLIPD
jgi:hypothetical protein